MAEIVNKPENPFEAQKYFKKHALNHISKQELYEYSSAITNIQELDSDVEKYATAGRGYWIKRLAGDKTLVKTCAPMPVPIASSASGRRSRSRTPRAARMRRSSPSR